MSQFQHLCFSREGTVALVAFNSPANRNAFTISVQEELRTVLTLVRTEAGIRSLVLTGSNGHFCSGGDLRNLAATKLDSAGWRARLNNVHHWLRDLVLLDKPVIAAVDGAAFGAGFSIALAADIVLVTQRARFSMAFVRLGLVPDCAAFYTLPRVVGAHRARELMLSGRELGATEALNLGIAMELHEPDRLLPRALMLATSFAQASPLAVSLIKRATADAGELDRLLDVEAKAQSLAFGSSEHRDATQRFLGKQPLPFQWPVNRA